MLTVTGKWTNGFLTETGQHVFGNLTETGVHVIGNYAINSTVMSGSFTSSIIFATFQNETFVSHIVASSSISISTNRQSQFTMLSQMVSSANISEINKLVLHTTVLANAGMVCTGEVEEHSFALADKTKYTDGKDDLNLSDSLLHSEMATYAEELRLQQNAIISIEKEMYLHAADTNWLDYWGELFGVPRAANEIDSRYIGRIVRDTIEPNQNNRAIENIVEQWIENCNLISVVDSKGIVREMFHDGQYARNGQITYSGSIAGEYGQFNVDLDVPMNNMEDTIGDSIFVNQIIEKQKAAGITSNYFLHVTVNTDDVALTEAAVSLITTIEFAGTATCLLPVTILSINNSTAIIEFKLKAIDFLSLATINKISLKTATGTVITSQDIKPFRKDVFVNFFGEWHLNY